MFDRRPLQKLQQQLTTLAERSLDRHVRLAVTGLSRSGKTAFITALVHQLEQAGLQQARLPLWQVNASGRLLGARRVPQQHHHIPSFGYEAALAALSGEPPAWPVPTRGLSELRLELRYHSRHPLWRHLGGEASRLFLEIVDYPGEWLLDLPLLQQSYEQWSRQVRDQLTAPDLTALAAPWLSLGAGLDGRSRHDEALAARLAQAYTDYLWGAKESLGRQLIQPGRFVLPGEYAGAPVLQFTPWLWQAPSQTPAKDSLYAMFEQRFEHYKRHLVAGFYHDHFASFDRQVVLVDCLHPLQQGPAAWVDLAQTLGLLLQSFQYGQSNWWRRLFAPRIDRLLFAASKADHVTPDQHAALQSLLESLTQGGRAQARFEGIAVASQVLAAVRAGQFHTLTHAGKPLTVIEGTALDGTQVALFPGDLPTGRPDAAYWQAPIQPLALRPRPWDQTGPMAHLRLDQALEFLLGDKLR
ncbi:YcjX family protein [Pseudaeromonas sp. ZJS20]|uniref:YcjX family protein n=1 Tax=Pseudaeromonas aegiceratis TaxID=3153928 RepID=UPI00390CA1E4